MRAARWYVVLSVATGAVVFTVGATLLLTGHSATVGRPLASDCGIINCSATVPQSPPGTSTPDAQHGRLILRLAHSGTTSRAKAPSARHPSLASVSPAPGRAPSPATSPPSPPASPAGMVTVTYTLDLRLLGSLQGHFTIVNHGSAPLRRWVLAATLPGDHVEIVWGASHRSDGSTLILSPPSYQPSIAPGASQSAYFTATGNTARPTGCVFNSQACNT